MNPLPPPTEALDEQEREIARILRALPTGEPSPALDARILRLAANVSASSRRPRARWLASAASLWGIGGAAAAVLALGVGLQVLVGNPHPAERTSAPAQPMSDSAEDSATAVEFKEEQPRESDSPGPPSPSPLSPSPRIANATARRPPETMNASAAPAAAPASASSPQAFSEDRLDEHVATRAEARVDQGAAASAGVLAASPAMADSVAGAASQPMAKAAKSAEAARDSEAASNAIGSFERQRAQPAGEPPMLKPSTWLAEIRELRNAQRTDEARARLLQFRKRYPAYVIPSDLAPLLAE